MGQRFLFGADEGVVVGVASDVRHESLSRPPVTAAYMPIAILQRSAFNVYVRVTGAPIGYVGRIRDVVHDIDPDMPVSDLGPLASQVSASAAQPRLFTLLLGLFGMSALLLASIGVYGVVAQGVSRRRREIGIRMALGAQATSVVQMVVRHALRASILGTAIGLLGFLAASRVVRAQLYDVRASDPLILASAIVTLLAAALLAAWLPARRAASIDPMTVLRVE